MRVSIVVDLGFGDSGKGVTTDWLASRDPSSSLVIRFGGGHQIGHTVRLGQVVHTFCNYGAGTLRGVPTWYGPATTVFPPAILKEASHLRPYSPRLLLHPLAMVTTPWDIAWNHAWEAARGHGSCGVGFGATIERNLRGVRLFAKDVFYPWVFREKLQGVRSYFDEMASQTREPTLFDQWRENSNLVDASHYLNMCNEARSLYSLCELDEASCDSEHLIFEGHQGILLDQDHGIYPHVTRSSTGSAPALALLATHLRRPIASIDIYYVTRCYQTRHGTGPMSSEEPITLVRTECETNVPNRHQGSLRVAQLDPDLLEYALVSDKAGRRLNPGLPVPNRLLVVTCLDQIPGFNVDELLNRLEPHIDGAYGGWSPDSSDIRPLRCRKQNTMLSLG